MKAARPESVGFDIQVLPHFAKACETEQVVDSTRVGTIAFFVYLYTKCELYVWKLRKFDVIVTFGVINVTY